MCKDTLLDRKSLVRLIKKHNPVFSKSKEISKPVKKTISNFGIPLFERSTSQPIKNIVRKPSFSRSQSSGQRSSKKNFPFLEVSKPDYKPSGKNENNEQKIDSNRKFTFISPTKVKGHVKTKNKQKIEP